MKPPIKAITLDDMSRRCDFGGFSEAVQQAFRDPDTDEFSWSKLGVSCGALFRSAPSLRFMYGPLNKHFKERKLPKERTRKDDDYAQLERPDEIPEKKQRSAVAGAAGAVRDDDNDQTMEATFERIGQLITHLDRVCSPADRKNAGRKGKANIIQTLVDPVDPVQTIENFFDFAFLVKDCRIMQRSRDGVVDVMTVNPEDSTPDWQAQRKQMVLSLNMPDVKLIAALVAAEAALDAGNP
jgi:hypothetical protein